MRKLLATLVGLPLLLMLVWGALAYRLLWHPRTDPPAHTDVVYLLGGDPGGPEEGFRMLDQGVADTLVLSWLGHPPECDTGYRGHKVICTYPMPSTTQGESMQLTSLMTKYGWKTVTVATWRSHQTRTQILFGRCYRGPVRYHATEFPVGTKEMIRQTLYESGGLVKVALSPGCADFLPFGLSER